LYRHYSPPQTQLLLSKINQMQDLNEKLDRIEEKLNKVDKLLSDLLEYIEKPRTITSYMDGPIMNREYWLKHGNNINKKP